jgi:hypothetical protein
MRRICHDRRGTWLLPRDRQRYDLKKLVCQTPDRCVLSRDYHSDEALMKREFHYTVETSKSFEVAVQAIEQKTAEKGFRVLQLMPNTETATAIRRDSSRARRTWLCSGQVWADRCWVIRGKMPAKRRPLSWSVVSTPSSILSGQTAWRDGDERELFQNVAL